MIDYFTSEPMKYFAPPASMSKETKRFKLEQMINSGDYCFGSKIDGNWSRAVITQDRSALQTRGISKKTGTYGEIQDKVLFWNDVVKAFKNGTTVILGEVYMEGAIDRQIGAILRCLPDKALARQKDNPLHWKIFDVLCYDGEDLMDKGFEERIKYIPEVVKRINSPLVESVTYYEMDDTFFDKVANFFAMGLEGAVCYKKSAIYIPGKRGPHAWDSLKVKQEIESDIDCLITGIEKPTQTYTGKELSIWQYWRNIRTNELVLGKYFGEYQLGGTYEPVTKNFFYNLPGAIYTSVYDKNHNLVPLCKVAGLTDEMKESLRDNFDEWYLCPITLGGMMVSNAGADASGVGISIRHPYIKSIRKEDIAPDDCTLSKIIGG